MSTSTLLGFAGELLTFAGGIILSLDALRRNREFTKTENLQTTVSRLAGIELTMNGVRLLGDDAVELVFIKKSVRRALLGTLIVTSGFLCLLAARLADFLK